MPATAAAARRAVMRILFLAIVVLGLVGGAAVTTAFMAGPAYACDSGCN